MSAKGKGDDKDDTYEEAATQLVDLEDFRKYMEEEEEEDQARKAEVQPPAAVNPAGPSPMGASPMAPQPSSPTPPGPGLSMERDEPFPAKSGGLNCAILGILSLVPFVGLLLGPAAMYVSLNEQKAIQAGAAPSTGLTQVNIGLYGGAIGLAISLVALVIVAVS